jgi:methyl-accepting chemotaxis protein
MGLTEEESSKLADGVAGSFGESFTSIVKGTQSVKEAFKNMATSIVDQLFQVLVVQRLVGAISTGLQTNFPGLFGQPAPKGAAIGGSVQRGRPVIVGERGKELFVPASSGSIVANKNMQGGGVTINQTINVATGVQQTVRTEIASLMPQIAEATKSAVADARLRGGSYSKAFG